MRWLTALRLLLVALAMTMAVGCYSPTVPLPPPDEPAVGQIDQEGMVTIQGGATRYALVSVFNERAGQGVIVSADGAGGYVAKLAAKIGDTISIWQEVDGEKSPSIQITIKK